MLNLQFIGQNIHFVAGLFAAFACFATLWLYFDSWQNHRSRVLFLKWIAYLMLALAFGVYATLIEQEILGKSLFGGFTEKLSAILRGIAYAMLIVSEILNPLQTRPKTDGLQSEPANTAKTRGSKAVWGVAQSSLIVLPAAALLLGWQHFRRSTVGLERHLRPLAIAFLFFALFELISLAEGFRHTDNPSLYQLVAPFGFIWWLQQALLTAAAVLLLTWVWKYLQTRLRTQLLIIFTSVTLAAFLVSTVAFTFLLFQNVRQSALTNLEATANVLQYALSSKKTETLAEAEALAHNPAITEAIQAKNRELLIAEAENFARTKDGSTVLFTSDTAQVLVRGDDADRWGDSISSHPLVRRALAGESVSSVSGEDGVISPTMLAVSTIPAIADGKIVGTVSVSLPLDNALVDGIKASTGLDSTIYSGDTRSATTLVGFDNKSRWLGVKETDKKITGIVLEEGRAYQTVSTVMNRSYLGVYLPLKDIDNVPVGMLFIGQPQSTLLKLAGRSINLTFLIATLLLVSSIVPAFLLARFIERQF